MDIRKKIDYSKHIVLRRDDPKYFTISKMEHPFYIKNNLPIWSSKIGKSKSLGTIFRTKNGSYIKAKVLVKIATINGELRKYDIFWEFEVYNAEMPKKYIIDTYEHGNLEKYYDSLKMIADNHLRIFPAVIEKKSPKIDANYRAEWARKFLSCLAEYYAEKNPNRIIDKNKKQMKTAIVKLSEIAKDKNLNLSAKYWVDKKNKEQKSKDKISKKNSK
jgi:hypothetical protein